jgi:hypothetical protein
VFQSQRHSWTTSQVQDETVVKMIWAKLAGRYGQKFTSQWIDQRLAKIGRSEWSSVLAGLSEEQIAIGFAVWGSEWPPCAVEFKLACLTQSKSSAHKLMTRRLTAPKNKPLAKHYINLMRMNLAG